MRLDALARLWDVVHAGEAIQHFVAGLDAGAYAAAAELVHAAVERKFEVIGEALNQLSNVDPAAASRITELPEIVAFRNLLIHGYAVVNHDTVWAIIQDSLPPLLTNVKALLAEEPGAGG